MLSRSRQPDRNPVGMLAGQCTEAYPFRLELVEEPGGQVEGCNRRWPRFRGFVVASLESHVSVDALDSVACVF